MFTTDEVLAALHAVRDNGVAATAQTVAHHLGTRDWSDIADVADVLKQLVESRQLERFMMVWEVGHKRGGWVKVETTYYVPITGSQELAD